MGSVLEMDGVEKIVTKSLRTPSETLMAALSECDTAEDVLIIMRHKSQISWHETANSRASLLGLLEFVICCIRGQIMKEEMESDLDDDSEKP